MYLKFYGMGQFTVMREADMESGDEESPMCTVGGMLGGESAERYAATREWLRSAIRTSKELPSGYALGLASDADTLPKLAEFIALERQCCSFLDFVVRLDRGSDFVWLELTGGEGVQSFLAAGLVSQAGRAAKGFGDPDFKS